MFRCSDLGCRDLNLLIVEERQRRKCFSQPIPYRSGKTSQSILEIENGAKLQECAGSVLLAIF